MKPYIAIADMDDGTFAVLSIDPTKRVGTGCKAIVMSVHETRREAEIALQEGAMIIDVECPRCNGNGEIVTDWNRYKHPLPGDIGDEAVADCPDCFGTGVTDHDLNEDADDD